MPRTSAPSKSGQTHRELLEAYLEGELDAISAAVRQAVRSGSQEALQETLQSALEKLNVLYIKASNAHAGETVKLGNEQIVLAKALQRSTKVAVFA